ncbi:beta-glucan synthesis-associated protein KRE6 [Crucibulum laeve]|uniref:Beta-glucan synthesis-associated protein KRE6 n=1 Tax=Crucibulum laeve TaxID=68775 RepID=A0A5C3M079_9AGAR|nr:beta-glucan synthesis-associated protein KRE6 [Crucibulum laeve]
MSTPYTQQSSASATSLLPSHSTADLSRTGSLAGSSQGHGGASSSGHANSLAEKYSLSPSPATWGMPLLMGNPEPDDYLHNPDPRRDRKNDRGGHIFTARGIANLGCLFVLAAGMMMLFAGYPLLSHFTEKKQTTQGGFNLGGTNATGQVPKIPGNYGLIDLETPKEAYTKKSYMYPDEELMLVFSDEFNTDNRSFYPGDDPYWEAVDLHYWGTDDLEWYDPGQATTYDGALRLTLSKVRPADNHNLTYRSGMIQSWNKFCFTGGILEASVTLPGSTQVSGLWPAVWAMGNLGRAGFGGSLEGLWPFSYDSCDVGTLPNQTYPGTATPEAAVINGDPQHGDVLSYLPGQRLSACTCAGESHPGPMRPDGSYVGRAAPEIDMFEATVADGIGEVSLSAQWAPYNAGYNWLNTTDNVAYNDGTTHLNAYKGGAYQQTTSGLAVTNQNCYELGGTGCFATYAFEYKPGFDDAYITWVNDGKQAWTLYSAGMGPDSKTEISARPIPLEPMYIIANLGFSHNFGFIDFERIAFPAVMSIDWIRVYQRKDSVNMNCDPKEYPTAEYIETYKKIYTNPNITTWEQAEQPWPKNRLKDKC